MQCVYCGENNAATKDHVPSKGLLRKPYPADLPTVPSCSLCNGSFSKDEEYFRLMVVGLLCHTEEADMLFDDRISRSMDRNIGLEELMFGSLASDHNGVFLKVDYQRIFRIAEKIAKGLQFLSKGARYKPSTSFKVSLSEPALKVVSRGPLAPDFASCPLEKPLNGWEFTFFDTITFTVLAD